MSLIKIGKPTERNRRRPRSAGRTAGKTGDMYNGDAKKNPHNRFDLKDVLEAYLRYIRQKDLFDKAVQDELRSDKQREKNKERKKIKMVLM